MVIFAGNPGPRQRRDEVPIGQSLAKARGKTPINLALQGGGAHGAFTWGVLDRLARERKLFFTGFSGTSAGAMNGVVFADGFIKGSRDGAIRALEAFWHRVSQTSSVFSPLKPSPWDKMMGNWNIDHNPGYMFLDGLTRMMSPYELNPFNINPLREILSEQIDFKGINGHDTIRVFVTATNVRTCKARVFDSLELNVEMLLASACLPLMFQAVEIDGEPYWDGGYIGNPALYPLIHETDVDDLLVIEVNPINRPEVPRTSREILNRINEVSFNSTLMREMRQIATITKLIDQGIVRDPKYRKLRVHSIGAEEEMAKLGASSKLNPDWDFLQHLHKIGFDAADKWIGENLDKVGVQSSVDIFEKYL